MHSRSSPIQGKDVCLVNFVPIGLPEIEGQRKWASNVW